MPRGGPDGDQQPYQFAIQETDLGAIYQYLWGFAPVDSGGRVMYLDTFNNGLNGFGIAQTGAGLLPVLDSSSGDKVFCPPNSAKLDPGGAANDRSFIYREIFAGRTKRLGIEVAFSKTDLTPILDIQIDYNAIGFTPYLGVLRFDETADLWQVWRGGGVWTTIYNPGASVANRMHIQAKVVMDFSTGMYVRAFVGDQVFDISTLSMGTSSSSYVGYLIGTVKTISRGAGTIPMNIGYVLMTKDEP